MQNEVVIVMKEKQSSIAFAANTLPHLQRNFQIFSSILLF